MKLNDYIKLHIDETVEIPLDDIIITERIHKRGNPKINNKENGHLIIIVRALLYPVGKYTLIAGWNDYKEALSRGIDKIKCIITTDNRWAFVNRNLRSSININNILIFNSWKNIFPREKKVQSKINFYKKYGFFKDTIMLNSNGELVDGYATYIAAQQLGISQVPIKSFVR